MLQYDSKLQVLLSSGPEMLQYDSKLYVTLQARPLKFLRYKLLNVAIWF